MAQEKNQDSKWEGKSTVQLNNITAQQIWPLFEDFCAIHKWLPALDTEKCHHVEGAYGEPGLVRYCAFTEQASAAFSNGEENAPIKWCNERLLSMDPVQRTLSFEITENNLGFRSYVGNMKVIELDGGGCKIEWRFVCDPAEGMRVEDIRGFIELNLELIAERMRKELQARTTN